jgi:hypothetical protein
MAFENKLSKVFGKSFFFFFVLVKENETLLRFVRLEADLQHSAAECVSIQRSDGQHRLLVVCHRHETVSFALVRRVVFNYFHVLHRTEWPEQLPQRVFLGLRRQIVHEYRPAAAGRETAGQCAVCGGQHERWVHGEIAAHRRETREAFIDRMVDRAQTPRELRIQESWDCGCLVLLVLSGSVRELDGDGFGEILGCGAVESSDRSLGLLALIEADEADALQLVVSFLGENARRDDFSKGSEDLLELLLRDGLRQAGDVKIGSLDGFGAGTSERHLDGLVLEAQPIENVHGLFSILRSPVVDEAVAERLSAHRVRIQWVGEGNTVLVAHKFDALHFSDG